MGGPDLRDSVAVRCGHLHAVGVAEPRLPAGPHRGLVNDIGDWMLSLALPIYVFTETGSGRDTAAVFLIELVVGVAFGPYGGALADRWDLRRTIIATNLLRAVTLLPHSRRGGC